MLILGSHLLQECIEGLPLAVFCTRFPQGWYAVERFVVKPAACTLYGMDDLQQFRVQPMTACMHKLYDLHAWCVSHEKMMTGTGPFDSCSFNRKHIAKVGYCHMCMRVSHHVYFAYKLCDTSCVLGTHSPVESHCWL
jgi:hypothetical protein